ncbi:MAG: COX15/CtaA family protein [Candidatus Caldarchaeum sp.]|nr:COX15/CtaA family protein [Candidatus Caldarchaeum sp.]
MTVRRLFKFALSTTVLSVVTMTMGSYVSRIGAGMACPDWPLCPFDPDPFIVLEFSHRIVAFATFIAGLFTFVTGWKTSLRPLSFLAFTTLVLQVFLVGAVVIYTAIPPIVVAVHQAFAASVLALHSSLATAAYIASKPEKPKIGLKLG